MRVAFLYPEMYEVARFGEQRKEFPPFGVLYLASIIRNAGHDVELMGVTEAVSTIDLSSFDVVGFSLSSSASVNRMSEARRRATFRNGATVLVGGVHANLYPDLTFELFEPDALSFSEADKTIVAIVEHAGQRDLASIPGVMWRDTAGKIIRTKASPARTNLDSLPLPARDLLPESDVIMTDRLAGRDIRMMHVMLNRGCPYGCRFCAAGKTRVSYRSGVSVRAELESLLKKYKIEGFAIVDDNFVINKPRVKEVCEAISNIGLSWSALSRVDRVDPELLRVMADAGCIELKFGVESGSERMLRAMGKKTSRKQIVDAFSWATDAGIEAKAFIMHGYPGENRESTSETIDLLKDLGDRVSRVSLFRFVPLPGSEVYESGTIRGTHLANDWDGDWSRFHIHHNSNHWWGNENDFKIITEEYERLRNFIEERWKRQG